MLRTGERHLDVADVTGIVDGVGTDNLRSRRARGLLLPSGPGGDDRFFSLLTAARSYDFEASSVNQKKVLVRALAFLVKRGGNPLVRAGRQVVIHADAGGAGGGGGRGRRGGGGGGGGYDYY